MPKSPAPPTRVQLAADALIAAPRGQSLEELRDAISAIKKLYYAALGNVRRAALRRRLDEHYAGLIRLAQSADGKTAARARRALPPALIPKSLKKPKR